MSNCATELPDKLSDSDVEEIISDETERVEELQLTCTEKVYNKMLHTAVWKSQLSAGYIGIISWPESITDGAPGLIPTQLQSSLVHIASSHQPDVSVVTEIYEHLCRFLSLNEKLHW